MGRIALFLIAPFLAGCAGLSEKMNKAADSTGEVITFLSNTTAEVTKVLGQVAESMEAANVLAAAAEGGGTPTGTLIALGLPVVVNLLGSLFGGGEGGGGDA